VACLQPGADGKPCAHCQQPGRCVYSYLFETPLPEDAAVLRRSRDVPHPLIMEGGKDSREEMSPGNRFEGRFLLIGRGEDYLSYVVAGLKRACETGLGRGYGRARLDDVWAEQPYTATLVRLYSASGAPVAGAGPVVTAGDIAAHAAALPPDRLTLRFLTPTRLVTSEQVATRPDFAVLVRSLLRRVSSLAYFHGGQRWDIDFRAASAAAEQVRLAVDNTHWLDRDRYSTRQRQRTPLGGLVGSAAYAGDLRPFLPLLALGELVHVGKATAFGNGRYEIGGVGSGEWGVGNGEWAAAHTSGNGQKVGGSCKKQAAWRL
jgi:hypothetical protein